MEGFFDYSNSNNIENDHKMDIETSLDTKHSQFIKNYVFSRRTMNFLPTNKSAATNRKKFSLPSVLNNSNIDIVKTMDEIMSLINDFNSKNTLNFFNINKINGNNYDKIKTILIDNLKKLREELSKENIPFSKIKNFLSNNIQNFIEALMELLKNNTDDNILLETLWIINNLIFFISKYNDIVFFDENKICSLLINYLNKVQKKKPEYFIFEKIIRIFGNLIHLNNNLIITLFNNKVIESIVNNLNNPVSSFRVTCLWVLNKIIIILNKSNSSNYINYFINKNAITNYKFIFTRIQNHIFLDEMSEFFWFICELAKNDSTILIPIFFENMKDFNYLTNYNQIKRENALKNFDFILNNSLTKKMSQVSLRLISNLLVVCNNELKNEYLLNKFLDKFFEKKTILLFLTDILNSPKNKYDISLVKDALLLIFNLISFSPTKSHIFFKKGIINLISDRDYHVNKEVMRILYMAIYIILINSSNSFESNDEKVIRACLSVFKRFKEEENMLIIFIDILYSYLKASKSIIYNTDIENELQLLKNENNTSIEQYQNMFIKLANIVKEFSPLSKFMRNI